MLDSVFSWYFFSLRVSDVVMHRFCEERMKEIKKPDVLLNLGAFNFLFHISILCLTCSFNAPLCWFLLGKMNTNAQ